MHPVNLSHIPIPKLRIMFTESLNDGAIYDRNSARLDHALHFQGANFKLLHHLIISRYAKVTMHHSDTMFSIVGLDIETNHKTGEPKLFGFSYDDGTYYNVHNPTLESLYRLVSGLINNSPNTQIVTWGNLDIQGLIRLFNPNESERRRISSGLGGNYKRGNWVALPPCIREMLDGKNFFIDHYIAGRSMRLGIEHSGRTFNIWIYNVSQFYETTIAQTAKALHIDWIDFDRSTHLIDWDKYMLDGKFRALVDDSNRQDAEVVRRMANHLTSVFHTVFNAYPKLLVSAGSLADAAVSTLLNRADYESNSWRYLRYSTFKDSPFVDLAESLLSEAYSAGYVDQFGIGYFDDAYMADISSAYPHKIRQLPDLRECVLIAGKGDPNERISRLKSEGLTVFTAVINGTAHIPEHLTFHPITIKNSSGQNFRPIGRFEAAYMLEERDFCIEWGARFTSEEYVIFAVKSWKPAPIAQISYKLAGLRDEYISKRDATTDTNERVLYDSMQYMVKVVDNSLYGKNVMTVAIVEDIDGIPTVTGLRAGDRFNQLYGAWITATTRVQIAEACMELQRRGSRPIMAMTDSIFWQGNKLHMPQDMIATHKTAGKFEPPELLHNVYVVKTGQYEYSKNGVFSHKMRGLNLPFEERDSSKSFYHDLISEWSKSHMYSHAEDVEIPVNTRKLVTIGAHDLQNLGLVQDSQSLLKPFVLSGKQVEPWIANWQACIDGFQWLKTTVQYDDGSSDSPMAYLSGLHTLGGDYVNRHQRKRIFYLTAVKVTGKATLPKRLANMSWQELEAWSGIKREWVKI